MTQGSVLESDLYVLVTNNIPNLKQIKPATFAADYIDECCATDIFLQMLYIHYYRPQPLHFWKLDLFSCCANNCF